MLYGEIIARYSETFKTQCGKNADFLMLQQMAHVPQGIERLTFVPNPRPARLPVLCYGVSRGKYICLLMGIKTDSRSFRVAHVLSFKYLFGNFFRRRIF